jgi:hypothetical protein
MRFGHGFLNGPAESIVHCAIVVKRQPQQATQFLGVGLLFGHY